MDILIVNIYQQEFVAGSHSHDLLQASDIRIYLHETFVGAASCRDYRKFEAE
jgi:hypothetical protein